MYFRLPIPVQPSDQPPHSNGDNSDGGKVDGDEMVDDELEYVLLSGLSMMATVMTVMGLMMTTVLKN